VDDHERMRASDAERQEVIERLRTALDEGRLKMDEYVERMERALEAATYGELATLHSDLPATDLATRRPATVPAPAGAARPARRNAFADLPTPLKVLWTIWGSIVSINLVIWVLVSVPAGHVIYPWPVWVAGPPGAALLAVSAGVSSIRRGRRTRPAQITGGGQADKNSQPRSPHGRAGENLGN
jgi:Domain of unknown function (DUF1707)